MNGRTLAQETEIIGIVSPMKAQIKIQQAKHDELLQKVQRLEQENGQLLQKVQRLKGVQQVRDSLENSLLISQKDAEQQCYLKEQYIKRWEIGQKKIEWLEQENDAQLGRYNSSARVGVIAMIVLLALLLGMLLGGVTS